MNTTIRNKRATHDYTIEERFETGLVLRGWEVKSVRAGRAGAVFYRLVERRSPQES